MPSTEAIDVLKKGLLPLIFSGDDKAVDG